MIIDFPTLIISLSIFVPVAVIIYSFILLPLVRKQSSEDKREVQAENIELKKKVGEYDGIARMEQMRNVERFQNIAVMNSRVLITKFTFWEKPTRVVRDILSLITAGVITLIIAFLLRQTHEMAPVDFALIGGFMFFFSYFLWGSIIETYWKQKQLGLLRKQFGDMMRLSANPLAARDGLVDWMEKSPAVNDKVKKMMEGILDKWLKEDLDKYQEINPIK